MAKFYLTDVPTTPKGSSRSRAANIPKEPYQVQGRPPTMPQINAKVQDINIEKNIPSLMQKELPREVSSGLVEGVQETGRAQARTGRASAAAAEAWGKAAQNMSETLNEVAVYLQKSKDIADESRVKNTWNMNEAQFQLEVEEGKLNGAQAMALWPKYQERIDTEVSSMNLSRHVRDSAIPELQVKSLKQQAQLTHNMRAEQAKSDMTAIETQRDYAAKHGDIEGATKATHDLYAAGHINAGQRDKMLEEDKTAYDEWRATTDITAAPREALPDLETAVQTGKSETYKHLPISSLISLRNFAKGEIERKETERLNSVANQVATNQIKTPDQVDAAAGGEVEARKLVPLKNSLNQEIPYSQESMAKIETAIFTYVKEAPDTGSPEYHRIVDAIHTTAPKTEWERLTSDLNKKRNEDKNNLPGEDWFNPIVKDVENLTEDGLFTPKTEGWFGRTPPAWTPKQLKDPKFRLEHKDEIESMWKQSRSIQIQLREWRKLNPGNDHKTQDEAYKFRNDLLKSQGADAGRAPIRKAVTPPLPTTGTMGTPAPTGAETSSLAPVTEQDFTTPVAEMAAVTGTKPMVRDPGGEAQAVAKVTRVSNPGSQKQKYEGVFNLGTNSYQYTSGGGGRGSLPPGKYVVTEHRYSRDTPGMTVGDVGFSFALSDKYDQRVGDTRTLLRIHPDGGSSGTAGCIGIVGGKEVQKQFRDDMTAAIRQNGGKLLLRVGT